MKALKNESKQFLESIITAIADCCATAEPPNTELTKLYYSVGKNICEQGEKAFVVHLAPIPQRNTPKYTRRVCPVKAGKTRRFFTLLTNAKGGAII